MSEVVLSHRGAEILFDVQDKNIRLLESLFHVQINARGERLFVEGEEQYVVALEKILEDFSNLVARDVHFSNGDLQEAFEHIAQQGTLSLKDFFPKKSITSNPFREVVPRSPNQIQYVRAIEHTDLVFSIGPAGTGKTYLAVAMAISFLIRKQVRRIVLARPATRFSSWRYAGENQSISAATLRCFISYFRKWKGPEISRSRCYRSCSTGFHERKDFE